MVFAFTSCLFSLANIFTLYLVLIFDIAVSKSAIFLCVHWIYYDFHIWPHWPYMEIYRNEAWWQFIYNIQTWRLKSCWKSDESHTRFMSLVLKLFGTFLWWFFVNIVGIIFFYWEIFWFLPKKIIICFQLCRMWFTPACSIDLILSN